MLTLPQVDSEAVRREQQEALDRVSAAVIAAQEILAGGTLETGKRKAGLQAGDKTSKRARIYGFEDFSDPDSDDDSEYEAAARLAKAGQVAATASSGEDSEASAQETALAIASAGPDAPSTSAAAIGQPDQSSSDAPRPEASTASPVGQHSQGTSFSPLRPVDSRPLVPSLSQTAAATASGALAPPDGKTQPEAATASDQAATSEAVSEADQAPVDLAGFSSPSELEGVGMVRLKNELQRYGLKCGGSSTERAARLFLLKSTTVDKLDQQHFSKPAKKKQGKKPL